MLDQLDTNNKFQIVFIYLSVYSTALSYIFRSQTSLHKICFSNTNFNKAGCTKLLVSCLGSIDTVQYLDISNCKSPGISTYESIAFVSCIERFSKLCVLKIEYFALSNGVLEAIISSKNGTLMTLEVFVNYHVHENENDYIPDEHWSQLCSQCPKLKVSFYMSKYI